MNKNEENINALIDGCRKNDRKAQELLYRNFYRAMMNLCVRYTKNERDALEAMNKGFYKVFKNILRYDASKSTLYTWIRTIILNSCLDLVKAHNSKPITAELLEATQVNITPSVFSKMSAAEILVLVQELPPSTQAVFNLYVMDGYNHGEIAKLMSISEGTSKWHLSEARKKLQKMMADKGIFKY